jgi:beta-lactamase superfamily II metal-dependent hydrolase
LRYEWGDWLNKKKLIQDVELQLRQIFNKNIPSLSSIMFLVNCNNNKILSTGGGLGKDVIDAPSKNGTLDKQGILHIDVLKVPHHGIDRNVTMKFFNPVSANHCHICK